MKSNVIDEMAEKGKEFPHCGLANFFAVIIPIKIELLDKMEQSLNDLKDHKINYGICPRKRPSIS